MAGRPRVPVPERGLIFNSFAEAEAYSRARLEERQSQEIKDDPNTVTRQMFQIVESIDGTKWILLVPVTQTIYVLPPDRSRLQSLEQMRNDGIYGDKTPGYTPPDPP